MRIGTAPNLKTPTASVCALLASLALVTPSSTRASSSANLSALEFNSDFLQGGQGPKVDLARFANDSPVLPGDYLVDVDLNDRWLARVKVRFVATSQQSTAQPCIDASMIAKLRLTASAIPAPIRAELALGGCADLPGLVKDAVVNFDQATLRLSVRLPQAMLKRRARGYVGPEAWDRGVPSAMLSYDTSIFRASNAGTTTTSVFAGLTAGLNLGNWHFRQRSSLSAVDGAWRFQNVATYVQHDLPRLKSSLTIGDTFTDGAVFDSFGFRGVSLATDDRMRPESQQGYAPVVRGIARTNARVRVSQNGSLLLETTVSPGPFVIDDLYPTGYGGDLLVTVLEADGSQESFTVTYAALVQLLRPHTWRYSLAAGELNLGGIGSGRHFFQGAVQHGLSNSVTSYAGVAIAPGYASVLFGAAVNTPLGAVAVDATLAQAHIAAEDPDQGYSVRVSYSKIVPGILTNISVAGYRYSSSGFWSMRDAMAAYEASGRGLAPRSVQRHRNRFQVNLSQSLGPGWGSIYLSGSATSYWARPGSVVQLQAGYNNVAHFGQSSINYGLSYVRQHDDVAGQASDRVLLTLSAALGEKPNSPRLAVNLSRDESGGQARTNGQVSLGGVLGADNEYTYNADVIMAPNANSVSVGGSYRPGFATLTANASKGTNYGQFSLGASGGLVIHPGGATLANQLGDTIGIVEALDAKGARISSVAGARINGAGYAVLPYLMPYRINEVAIDPEGSARDVELRSTSQQVAPRANAVVMVKFDTISGRGVMVSARLPNGDSVPFGASAYDAQGAEIGIAGQDGQIFLRGIPDTGTLQVKWGDLPENGCSLGYQLSASHLSAAALLKVESVCVPTQLLVQGNVVANQATPRIEALPI